MVEYNLPTSCLGCEDVARRAPQCLVRLCVFSSKLHPTIQTLGAADRGASARTTSTLPQWLVYDCSGNGDAGEGRGARRSRGSRSTTYGRARGEAHALVSERAARAAAGHRSGSSHRPSCVSAPAASALPRAWRSRSTCSPKKGFRTSIGCSPCIWAATASGRKWTNLWTAEEDRHGAVLHDYTRDSQLLDNPVLEQMQFEYIKAGFEPAWDKDPYRVFVYTTLQERATQVSHANTGKLASRVRADDRHRARERREGRGAALRVLSHDLQGSARARSEPARSSRRRDHAVDRHAGREHAALPRDGRCHPPRRHLRAAGLSQDRRGADQATGRSRRSTGSTRSGRKAQEKIMGIPARLERIADAMETRSKAKTFSFVVAFAREFAME